jgi:hypothetical protein
MTLKLSEDMPQIGAPRSFRQNARRHADTGICQALIPLPAYPRIRIVERRHDTRNARRDDRIGARRGFAVMAARLESDVERRAPGRLPRLAQRFGLGMGTAT